MLIEFCVVCELFFILKKIKLKNKQTLPALLLIHDRVEQSLCLLAMEWRYQRHVYMLSLHTQLIFID